MRIQLRSVGSATAVCLTALSVGLAVAGPATATGRATPSSSPVTVRQPPSTMSTVGGDQLGRPGVQVNPQPGAPALPARLSALSWMVSDADTGAVLAAENPHWQLPPASTLKTLFADTVLPKIPDTSSHKVADSDLAGMGEGSSEVGVLPGQTYTVPDLWLGVFLRSGNDAVHVLAAMNGGVAATVQQMQAEAVRLGASDTHVVSPDGYDMPGQVSSAYDLSLFAREGLRNADFARYCSTPTAKFPGGPDTKGKPFEIDNTDRLLSGIDGVPHYDGLIGVKNGYTTNAGNTLVVAARRDGHTVLVSVMNPQDHALNAVYSEARELLDWGFAAEGKVSPVGSLNPAVVAQAASTAGAGDSASVRSKPPASGPMAASSRPGGPGTLAWIGGGTAVLLAGAAGVLVLARRKPARLRRRSVSHDLLD
ncbi:D-alanyl-D-alanine carboxypeptidase family protein [Streptacidiphilus sp. EB129]|uniref:D-alanyl-D-alanine carboxypeptidase family protein n=1 Tax=Streptacidiphilus sp. EB129 TaxID=3156262 RepID=UPI0035117C23